MATSVLVVVVLPCARLRRKLSLRGDYNWLRRFKESREEEYLKCYENYSTHPTASDVLHYYNMEISMEILIRHLVRAQQRADAGQHRPSIEPCT